MVLAESSQTHRPPPPTRPSRRYWAPIFFARLAKGPVLANNGIRPEKLRLAGLPLDIENSHRAAFENVLEEVGGLILRCADLRAIPAFGRTQSLVDCTVDMLALEHD